jgi:hypothetical protein
MLSWAEEAIETACVRAEAWYRELPAFPNRVNLGSVVGGKHPALVSEHDCVIHFARFLNEAGVAWEDMHHQVSRSRWLFEPTHAASDAGRWCVDLALLRSADFLAASLPSTDSSFQFDASLEFAYLGDYWMLPGVHPYGQPAKGRLKVENDVDKVGRYIAADVCRAGYVIVFEECDSGFADGFAGQAEARTGCRVRFIRGYEPAAAELT